MEDSYLIIFKAISNFVTDLGESFGTKQRSLLLYRHLIEKTTIIHEEPIKKHITAWRNFCKKNSDAIIQRDYKNLVDKILYSEKVYIDLGEIFPIADKTETDIIWKHLLTIHAFLDPTSKAKEILKNSMKKGGGKEDEFLHNIIDQVEQHVDPSSNPMEAVNSIMNSGLFSNLVQGMNSGVTDGSMDLGRLLNSVNNMVTSLGQMAHAQGGGSTLPPEMSQMTNMLDSMIKSMPTQGLPTQGLPTQGLPTQGLPSVKVSEELREKKSPLKIENKIKNKKKKKRKKKRGK